MKRNISFVTSLQVIVVTSFVLSIFWHAGVYATELLEKSEDSMPSQGVSWEDVIEVRREEALEKLQKIFGIRGQTEKESAIRHKTPPEFMMELYKTITDPSGVTRGRNPYNAKVVRSFIERDTLLTHLYLFNISGLEVNESVLEAELHLHRKRTTLKDIKFNPTILKSPYYLIRVYQVLEGKSLDEPDLHRLLNVHYVGAHASGWQVFNVKQAVLAWVSGVPNLGLMVTASNLFGDDASVEFTRRNEQHHHSKQPILVLFNDDGKEHDIAKNSVPHYYTYDNESDDYHIHDADLNKKEEIHSQDEELEEYERENFHRKKRQEEPARKTLVNNEINYKRNKGNVEYSYGTQLGHDVLPSETELLERRKGSDRRGKRRIENREDNIFINNRDYTNDEDTVKINKIVSQRKTRMRTTLSSMDIYERALLRKQQEKRKIKKNLNDNEANYSRNRQKRSIDGAVSAESEELNSYAGVRANRTECKRHKLYIDFHEIGLSSSIIAPSGYSAYHCQGLCDSALGQDQLPTNHAIVQGIVYKMRLLKDVHMPCCVPTKLLSARILFYDEYANIVLKEYEDMVAARCGCR